MEFIEYGKKNCPTVLLVDDLACPIGEDNMTSALLQDYHIIVPVKNSTEDACQKAAVVERYVRQHESGKLYAICCTLRGWSLIREILARKGIRSDKVIVGTQENNSGALIVTMLKEFALEDRILVKHRKGEPA